MAVAAILAKRPFTRCAAITPSRITLRAKSRLMQLQRVFAASRQSSLSYSPILGQIPD